MRYCLVVYLSKYPHSNISGGTLTIGSNDPFDNLPESIIMDREVQFAVKMMKELNNILKIDTKLSIDYYHK